MTWCVLAAALLGAVSLAPADPAATAAAVRKADQAFEARAEAVGPAQAFRDYMDPIDGLQFNGGPPVRGAEAIYRAMGGGKPQPRLRWSVVDAWGSAGGDMGVTTGTWTLTLPGARAPSLTGRYVTVWRKDAAGAWKGLIDIGTPDAK